MNYLRNKTRILVTHKFESLQFVDYIYIFQHGRIVEEGTLDDLKDSPVFTEIEKISRITQTEGDLQTIPLTKQIPKALELHSSDRQLQTDQETDVLKEILITKEQSQEVTKEEQVLRDKLMLDEDRAVGDVGWHVWKAYFTYYGGWFYFLLVLLSKIRLIG